MLMGHQVQQEKRVIWAHLALREIVERKVLLGQMVLRASYVGHQACRAPKAILAIEVTREVVVSLARRGFVAMTGQEEKLDPKAHQAQRVTKAHKEQKAPRVTWDRLARRVIKATLAPLVRMAVRGTRVCRAIKETPVTLGIKAHLVHRDPRATLVPSEPKDGWV